MFSHEEFAAAGATLVPEGFWPQALKDHIIVGLKELPNDDFPLVHWHIQFGHCYKGQEGWASYLDRFVRGGGILYDIEFLTDALGKRVAAFGYHAGYAEPGNTMPIHPSLPSDKVLVNDVKSAVAAAVPLNNGQNPHIVVIGALGRCGTGAVDLCRQVGLPESDILKWNMAETARGGPFEEIAAADIFVNCIYLTKPIPPFVTRESLSIPGRKLRVVCDVSCDPTDPKNPVPLYTVPTTFTNPTSPVDGVHGAGPEWTITAIDRLPNLVAREASDAFSNLLPPSLKVLDRREEEGVWGACGEDFQGHCSHNSTQPVRLAFKK